MKSSVLIFDSGVGGLSILSEIRQKTPAPDLLYLMDNAFFPYGIKPDDVLISRILSVCLKAVDELSPDVLVIACNTASTLVLDELRARLNIPVVGVVPAIKVAAELTPDNRIGLLATPATVNRPYTDRLISDFASHCEVTRFGSSHLVQWAEDYLISGEVPAELFGHLNPWLQQHPMSHIVLGCTHFPLLRDAMESLWPGTCWVDSGEAIARRVASLMNAQNDTDSGKLSLFWTDAEKPPQGALRYLQRLGQVRQSRPLST